MKKTEKFDFQRIPSPLLLWYTENKRELPWRREPTPYRVWVSEIMLQQTRVEAVKEYYLRFMAQLPTVEDLAFCEEERLLKLWEGLGYYTRARNLQKTARKIVTEYDGVFPTTVEELQTLPGVGRYTAGAIASIAYGMPVAAVDGNVFRVCSRLEENPTVISEPKYRRYLEETLSSVYPPQGKACADFTQSLFELGALVCKPKNPDCARCPLKGLCCAYQNGTQEEFPVLPQKMEKRRERVYVYLIETPEGFCIRRREEGVLRGMNEFPSAVVTDGETPENILDGWGVTDFIEIKRQKFTHIFTHIHWEMLCVWVRTNFAPFDAYTIGEIQETISLPTAFKQCLRILGEK